VRRAGQTAERGRENRLIDGRSPEDGNPRIGRGRGTRNRREMKGSKSQLHGYPNRVLDHETDVELISR
jgi:hypothetical protein